MQTTQLLLSHAATWLVAPQNTKSKVGGKQSRTRASSDWCLCSVLFKIKSKGKSKSKSQRHLQACIKLVSSLCFHTYSLAFAFASISSIESILCLSRGLHRTTKLLHFVEQALRSQLFIERDQRVIIYIEKKTSASVQ